ncbi:MAG: hypothetical protein AB7Q29_13500 [Vicinamibacterales bacterium]
MADGITKGDLLEIATDLRDHIDDRLNVARQEHGQDLRDIKQHLATLNGKVATHEAKHAEIAVRITNVEREIFRRPRRSVTDAGRDDEKPAVSRGDMKRLAGGLALLGVVLELLHNVGEFLFGLVRAGLHGAGK